jgi:hypothetical protein
VLAGGVWRTAVCLAPDAAEPRFHALPGTLSVAGGVVRVGPAPRPGPALRVARGARKLLGAVVAKAAARIRKART